LALEKYEEGTFGARMYAFEWERGDINADAPALRFTYFVDAKIIAQRLLVHHARTALRYGLGQEITQAGDVVPRGNEDLSNALEEDRYVILTPPGGEGFGPTLPFEVREISDDELTGAFLWRDRKGTFRLVCETRVHGASEEKKHAEVSMGWVYDVRLSRSNGTFFRPVAPHWERVFASLFDALAAARADDTQ
jgi:hypothetical protein